MILVTSYHGGDRFLPVSYQTSNSTMTTTKQNKKHYLVGKSAFRVPTIRYLKCPVFNKKSCELYKGKGKCGLYSGKNLIETYRVLSDFVFSRQFFKNYVNKHV